MIMGVLWFVRFNVITFISVYLHPFSLVFKQYAGFLTHEPSLEVENLNWPTPNGSTWIFAAACVTV